MISIDVSPNLIEALNPVLDLHPLSLKIISSTDQSFHAEFYSSETGFTVNAAKRVLLDVSVTTRGHDMFYEIHAVEGFETLSILFYEADKLPKITLNLGEDPDPRRVKAIAKFFDAFIESFSNTLYIHQKEYETLKNFSADLNTTSTENANA